MHREAAVLLSTVSSICISQFGPSLQPCPQVSEILCSCKQPRHLLISDRMLGLHGGHETIHPAGIGGHMASMVGTGIARSELPTRIVAGPQRSELAG